MAPTVFGDKEKSKANAHQQSIQANFDWMIEDKMQEEERSRIEDGDLDRGFPEPERKRSCQRMFEEEDNEFDFLGPGKGNLSRFCLGGWATGKNDAVHER